MFTEQLLCARHCQAKYLKVIILFGLSNGHRQWVLEMPPFYR